MDLKWKKMFKTKKISELTNEQLAKKIKLLNQESWIYIALSLEIIVILVLWVLQFAPLLKNVPLTPILSSINQLLIVLLFASVIFVFMIFYLWIRITQISYIDIAILELQFEKRLREMKQEILKEKNGDTQA